MKQTDAILAYLLEGFALTPPEAADRFNCGRLAARMHEIRAMGHDVRDAWIRLPSGKRVKRYWIEHDVEPAIGRVLVTAP